MRARADLMAVLLLAAASARAAGLPSFAIVGGDPGGWPAIFSSIGLEAKATRNETVVVARAGNPASAEWEERVQRGALLVLEGESPLAEMFGFHARKERVRVASLQDVHRPQLQIVWEREAELPVFEIPAGAKVYARERWRGAPVLAGLRRGAGAVLWVATDPGAHGHERFPYLLDALCDLGLEPPFRTSRLWAFFDSSYRTRADLDYFARRWRAAGIAGLHVAAWHFFESTGEGDEYLKRLIAACHREGIAVYAWLELPHVSDAFWAAHPEWREKTAILQDAQLDWRKLMNLTNPECLRAVAAGVNALLDRFDWDGVNVAELYFESLEGMDNPARFTPMNDDVRELFRQKYSFDPVEIFGGRSDAASRRLFLDFRRELATRMEQQWLEVLERARARHSGLDLVLTHVDDRLDPAMRDAIGADAAAVMPLLRRHDSTLLIEDPATVWNLSAERYGEIAERYRSLTDRRGRLAIDLNVVERYQDVYPVRQLTGAELLQTVHQAASSFPRVALYFESSLLPSDWRLLGASGAAVRRAWFSGKKLVVETDSDVGVNWRGPVVVDGQPWPLADDSVIWLPAGKHTVERGGRSDGLRVVRFTGSVRSAKAVSSSEVRVSYHGDGRVFAILSRPPQRVEVDGEAAVLNTAGPSTLILPRGDHIVTIIGQ